MPLNYRDILEDASKRLYEAAKKRAADGASEESALLSRAAILFSDAAKLPFDQYLKAAESIANGILFGTAAIAEEQARAFWKDFVSNSLKFAANIGGATLKLLPLP